MAWGLVEGRVDPRGLVWEHVAADIQSLNEWALEGRLELTALSVHAFGRARDRYLLLPHGASLGRGYGPVVVAPRPLARDELRDVEIAVPGTLTTAYLVLREYLGGEPAHRVVPFDRVLDEVVAGRAAAGLVIHEGQLTYPQAGLAKCVDLGEWWLEATGLPLPLGVVAARCDLGQEVLGRAAAAFRDSIRCALAHPDEAVRFALRYARGLDEETAARFVALYVNDLSVDLGEEGRRAVDELLARVG